MVITLIRALSTLLKVPIYEPPGALRRLFASRVGAPQLAEARTAVLKDDAAASRRFRVPLNPKP